MNVDMNRLRSLALSETGFVFDPITGYTYNLNPMATELLKRLQKGETADVILAHMKANYDADANEIERDWEQFLERLREYGLLVEKVS
jgi:PqqD family protein of HPr-rel-A system